MSARYREHGRRQPQPLPPSSLERPWVLLREKGPPTNQVAYLLREQENGYIGVLLYLNFAYGCWELVDKPARLVRIPKTDVQHVFAHEPVKLQDIHAARL